MWEHGNNGSNDDKTTSGLRIKVRGFVSMDAVTFWVWQYISSQQHEVSIAMFRGGQQRYFEISYKG